MPPQMFRAVLVFCVSLFSLAMAALDCPLQTKARVSAKSLCALPDIYWIGDLGGDGKPEIILVQSYEQRLIFSLLSSQGSNAEAIMKLQAQFIQSDCD